jgi:hypothetical protein
MNSDYEPLQKLLLWRLAMSDDGEFLKDIKTSLAAAKRKALIRDGLIAEQRRKHPNSGRAATFLTLEDRGWTWCQTHLTDDLRTRSTQTTPILERLLKLLASYFERQDETTSLGQLVLQARRPPSAGAPAHPGNASPVTASEIRESIAAACLEFGKGERNIRVRLSQLRERLGDQVSRAQLDETLLEMERRGELALYPLENPLEIGPADRAAVLRTGPGLERHLVYFIGLK